MSEMQALDLSRLLLVHTGLTMVSSLSISPPYNFALSLYGLIVVNKAEGEGGGDSVRQFAALLGASFLFDLLWLMSGGDDHAATLAMLCIIANLVLKPITFLALLGHLRQRGEPTFAMPASFSLPGSFPGGFPPRPSETVWQAPGRGYHSGFQEDEEEEIATARPPPTRTAPPKPPAEPTGGYHSIE